MIVYTKKFQKLRKQVDDLQSRLDEKTKEFQKECPHTHLNGSSAFPKGTSFTDCEICGMSNYYV